MLWAVLRNEKGLQADAHSPDYKLYLCNARLLSRWNFLKQMLSQDNQVLNIDDAVTPRDGADVAE